MAEDLEILAPAGDEKSFFVGINNGANAIYLGLKNFNARNKAENFDLDNLRKYIEIAHLNNIRVYVVVNTLVTNSELQDLLYLVEGAIKLKVDAFIVQDLGVANLLNNTFKGIVLHASTQMGIHSLQGAKVAQELGFKRIVLSREVTKQDIIDIKNNTNLEIEYFVHGALCVSFSGNCYFSSIANNESGNRGRCLQPCRLLYTSISQNKRIKKGYLLSATDLCLIDKIKDLKECGVCSLKIEGRLRRPSYVAYVTRVYSDAKNEIAQNKPFSSVTRVNNFKKLFNRGEYNTGFYLNGEANKNIINTSFQNHRGVKIGSVKSVKPFKDIYEVLIVSPSYEIAKNDGLKCIFEGEEKSLGVGSVEKTKNRNEYKIFTKVNPKVNSEVYLTVDSKWEEKILENKKQILFDAEFEALENNYAKLKLKVGNTIVECSSKEVLQPSKTHSLKKEEVKENLQKTKDTFFVLNNLNCNIQYVFMPKSWLNELRRMAIEKLQNEIIFSYEKENVKEVKIDYSYFKNLKESNFENNKNYICFNENTDFYEIEKNFTNNTNIVFSPQNFSVHNIKDFVSKIKQKFNVNKVYLDLPKVLRYEDFKEVEKIIVSFTPLELGIVANNIAHIYFTKLGYEVIGGVYLNITNMSTIQVLKKYNINTFVKSFEDFATFLKGGLTYVGNPAVMTFCHCPYKTNFENDNCNDCKYNSNLQITAENGKSYTIRRTKIKNCIFELVNCSKINFNEIGGNTFYLDLRK